MADADKSKKNRDGDLSKTADYGDLAPSKGGKPRKQRSIITAALTFSVSLYECRYTPTQVLLEPFGFRPQNL